MDQIASALADGARWRIVELLAERPPVRRRAGARQHGLRQPQTTKHLQTLARAGLVTVFPLGQRRVYALEAAPLAALEGRLARAGAEHRGARGRAGRHRPLPRRHRGRRPAVADGERWADGRTFSFERLLTASRDVVWRHWVDPELLASWWAVPSMTVAECALEPKPGGRAVLVYRDAEGRRYPSEGRVQRREGARAPRLRPLGPGSRRGRSCSPATTT